MPNFVSLCIEPCEPTPVGGYRVTYRPLGSSENFRTWPVNFDGPDVQFMVTADPDGTQYEGFIYGNCGAGQLGVGIPWATAAESESAASSSASASIPASPVCGQYRVTNTTGDDLEFFWTTCDGGTPSFVLSPAQVETMCIHELSPGVPDVSAPAGVTVEHLGACPGDGTIRVDACIAEGSITEVRWNGLDVLNVSGDFPVNPGQEITVAVIASGTHTLAVTGENGGRVRVVDSLGNVQCQDALGFGTLNFPGFVIVVGSAWSVTMDCGTCD